LYEISKYEYKIKISAFMLSLSFEKEVIVSSKYSNLKKDTVMT